MKRTVCSLVRTVAFASASGTTCPPAGYAPLITAAELLAARRQGVPHVVVDGSWHLGGKRDGAAEWKEARIEGAAYLNIDAAPIADLASGLPHMLPAAADFDRGLEELGIRAPATDGKAEAEDPLVVVYTRHGSFSAPRVWWTFRTFGHRNVRILSGGLEGWREAGGAVCSGDGPECVPLPLKASVLLADRVVDKAQMAAASASDEAVVVDARSVGRCTGDAPEPRPGVAGGRVPGSRCVPFVDLLSADDATTMKPPDEIEEAFAAAGVDVEALRTLPPGSAPVHLTCGSGVTAATLALGLALCGVPEGNMVLYDGSWSEWGADPDTPKEVGPL